MLYVGVYANFSHRGSYHVVPVRAECGECDLQYRIVEGDIWFPAGFLPNEESRRFPIDFDASMHGEQYTPSWLESLFCPLVKYDRKFIHPGPPLPPG